MTNTGIEQHCSDCNYEHHCPEPIANMKNCRSFVGYSKSLINTDPETIRQEEREKMLAIVESMQKRYQSSITDMSITTTARIQGKIDALEELKQKIQGGK